MQDFTLGERPDHGPRNHMHKELDGTLLPCLGGVGLDWFGIDRAGIDVHSDAWLPKIDNHQADHECQSGDRLEID